MPLRSIAGVALHREIHEGVTTVVHQGQGIADGRPVIVKMARPGPERLATNARLRGEYELLTRLRGPGVVQALGFEVEDGVAALLLEDFGGTSLRRHLAGRRLPLPTALDVAVKIADALAVVHAAGIVHRDVKPDNIIYDERSGRVALTDFSISATLLDLEATDALDPALFVGSLPYVAPEQTGRVHRRVDYRSDFYSLGVTLYELFTGRLPFQSDDPGELIHLHIAKVPPAPHLLAPEVPPPLSAVTVKLLAKQPELRYQSTHGLRSDLERCRREWLKGGVIAPFVPGERETPQVFELPSTLFGRDDERRRLLAALAACAEGGEARLVLLAGPSGFGKSSLAQALQRPASERGGRMLAGKFDLLARIPYDAVLQALQALIRQLLGEPSEVLERWQALAAAALRGNGRLLTEVIPELEALLGPQPPVPEVPPGEAENRFLAAFSALIRVFARREHPLVVLLDDLHWCDAGTLRLLEHLLGDARSGHLLIVGTYRDDEVDDAHPLARARARLARAGVDVDVIGLGPLAEADIAGMLASALALAGDDAAALAALTRQRTDGSPLFVRLFLELLHARGIIRFDHAGGRWTWDRARAAEVEVTDNVAALLEGELRRLPPAALDLLAAASLLGPRFSLDLLAESLGDDEEALRARLAGPLDERLILRVGGDGEAGGRRFMFAHDRVRHCAYATLSPARRAELHLAIGRRLLARPASGGVEGGDLEAAGHLNRGAALIVDPDERRRLLALNLAAARRTRAAAAYAEALAFIEAGKRLADDADDATMAALLRLEMECRYLGGDPEAAARLLQEVLARARSPLERADIRCLQVALDASRSRFEAAVRAGLAALAELGVHIPRAPGKAAILLEVARARLRVSPRRSEHLAEGPLLDEPRRLAILRLMINVGPAAYFVHRDLMVLIAMKMVNLSLRDGLSDVAPFGFASHAMVLAGAMHDYAAADALCRLAYRISDRLPNPWIRAKLDMIFGLFIGPWTHPLGACMARLRQAVDAALDVGDLEYANYSVGSLLILSRLRGQSLADGAELAASHRAFLQRHGDPDRLALAQALERSRQALERDGIEPAAEPGAGAPAIDAAATPVAAFIDRLAELELRVVFGDPRGALAAGEAAQALADTLFAALTAVEVDFYVALARLMDPRPPSLRERHALRGRIAAVERAAAHCEETFAPRGRLLRAEEARAAGRTRDALAGYAAAIAAARAAHVHKIEALASERAASLHAELGDRTAAWAHLRQARLAYLRWGATAKAAALVRAHPDALAEDPQPPLTRDRTVSTTTSRIIDLGSFIKTAQAISGEIQLDRLLLTLVGILVEAAGARRGVLLLTQDGALRIAAEGGLDRREAPRVAGGVALDDYTDLPGAVIRYVERSRRDLVLDDAAAVGDFVGDPYIARARVRSILCSPIVFKGQLTGVLYLEHDILSHVFTSARVDLLRHLATQAAIALENAKLYKNLDEARARAVAADATKTRFLMNMSHELRTPLNAIIGYAELIGEEVAEAEHFAGELQRIRSSAERLLRLLANILELTSLESGPVELRTEAFSIARLVDDVVAEVSSLAAAQGQTIAIELAGPDELVSDRGRLFLALHNLVDNACRFSRDGTVTIRGEGDDAALRLTVADTGPGVPPELLERIFDAFQQADGSTTRAVDGAGLGLTLCRRTCRLLGGELTVESAPGEGSRFTISLPRAPAGARP